MKEEITLDEWGKRIFDTKQYVVLTYDYDIGITFILDTSDGKVKSAIYNKNTERVIVE